MSELVPSADYGTVNDYVRRPGPIAYSASPTDVQIVSRRTPEEEFERAQAAERAQKLWSSSAEGLALQEELKTALRDAKGRIVPANYGAYAEERKSSARHVDDYLGDSIRNLMQPEDSGQPGGSRSRSKSRHKPVPMPLGVGVQIESEARTIRGTIRLSQTTVDGLAALRAAHGINLSGVLAGAVRAHNAHSSAYNDALADILAHAPARQPKSTGDRGFTLSGDGPRDRSMDYFATPATYEGLIAIGLSTGGINAGDIAAAVAQVVCYGGPDELWSLYTLLELVPMTREMEKRNAR